MKTNLTSSKIAGSTETGASKVNGKAHSGNTRRMKRPVPTNKTGNSLLPVKTHANAKQKSNLSDVGENSQRISGKVRQLENQDNDCSEEKNKAEVPFRTITAEQAKSLYNAVLKSYIEDAVYNLENSDEMDFNLNAAKEIYHTEITIGNLLRNHIDVCPADMTDFLPIHSDLPLAEKTPDIEAARTLFFMDHLHRILFRHSEISPTEQCL